ncbi:MAG: DUF1820 family protein [Spirochaetales bacterium]|nr:DUF1820 family protein [Spirochaetales bacterium]
MSLYKVHFKWKDKDVELMATSLDLTHPYFVSIKDMIFRNKGNLIIDPSYEDVLKHFGKANHLMIPFQTVTLIEEYKDEDEKRVMPFPVAEDGVKKQK